MRSDGKLPMALAVLGPTASGKTALAISLCERFNGEVISCDSMQIYRGMNIGTAKPSVTEMHEIKHHMLDVAEPCEEYSAADYAEEAWKICSELFENGTLPIFCGGTGLYLDGVEKNRYDGSFSTSEEQRTRLQKIYELSGAQELHKMLLEVDSESGKSIHPNNVKRVIRALEIFYSTGITKTEWDRRSKDIPKRVEFLKIGLAFNDRALLYDRIDRRVDGMIASGLEKEARFIYECPKLSKTASQAIGYKELFEYFDGTISFDAAIEKIKLASRNYAKRQLTWFSRYDDILWIYVDKDGVIRSNEEIFHEAETYVSKFFGADISVL